jgi:hypothetical protein
MAKKSTRDEEKKPAPKPRASAVKLIELRFGFFLNADQIVSVRVLPQQGDETYAVMQLSNGDKLNLTLEEFMAVTGKDPRPPVRLRQERRPEKPAKPGRS